MRRKDWPALWKEVTQSHSNVEEGGLSGCVLRQVFGTGDMQPRPEEMPLFKWGKPSEPSSVALRTQI